MNRKIKFRGKRLDNGEWVYGHYADYIHPDCGIPSPSVIYPLPDCGNMIVAVDPSTVGQFTGLYDRNGKEIYEGDVVEIISYYTSPREKEMSRTRAVIMFDETLAYFLGKSKSASFTMTCASNMEVVGNIHDNPELICNEQSKS